MSALERTPRPAGGTDASPRVLHATPLLDAHAGGPATALASLAEAQRAAGLKVSVVSTYSKPTDELPQRLRAQGIDVHMVGPCTPPLWGHPELAPMLEKLVAQADLVHVHALWEHVQHQAARAARRAGVPYIFTPHGMLDPWSLRQGWLKKQLYLWLRLRRDLQGAAAIHFTSQGERDGALPLRLRPPALVVPLGVDLNEFDPLPPRGRMRGKFPQTKDCRIVVYLGRLHAGKGLELLVPALASCGVERAMLLVVGPDYDGYRAVVQTLARQHGVADRVIFTGMLRGHERLEALVDSDLLALPSFHENFGLVVVEALACGTPVIVSDQVNIHREIAEAGVGAVVPTQVEALSAALGRWLTDDALRRAAADRAQPFTRRTYDLRRIAAQWIEHYRRIVEAHRVGGAGALHAAGT